MKGDFIPLLFAPVVAYLSVLAINDYMASPVQRPTGASSDTGTILSSPCYAPPIFYDNDLRYMDLHGAHRRVPDNRRVWGVEIEVLHPLPHPRATNRSIVKAGLQARMDILAPDFPRYNPSLALIPSTSHISTIATFVGTVRAGLTTYRGPDFFRQANQEGDPEEGVNYHVGAMLEMSGNLTATHQSYCEALLVDNEFGVIAQTRIETAIHGLYEDCRIMYLQRGNKGKPQLYVYTTAYHGTLETRFPLPHTGNRASEDLSATLRPLDLVVAVCERGGRTHMLFEAEHRDIHDPMSFALTDAVVWPPSGEVGGGYVNESQRPLQGKNHMFFEDDDAHTYVINWLVPLEIYRVVSKEYVERMPVIQPPAMRNMTRFSLNGGKMVVMPEYGGELLGMAHVHMEGEARYYTQVFFTMTSKAPFRITRLSHEFCFSSIHRPNDCDWIQLTPSLERVGDVLVIPYGRQDLEAMVFTMTVDDAMKMLRPLKGDEMEIWVEPVAVK